MIYPEIIQSLRHRIRETGRSIHLLPPKEALSSLLREIEIPALGIHTSFAWLGHGAIIPRLQAVEFLHLLDTVNATEEERKMADNYFTILSNSIPEIWFDQGLELGGGQPFTVGIEGDDRNNRHIVRHLSSINACINLCSAKLAGISTN